jgi:hypothetical protein
MINPTVATAVAAAIATIRAIAAGVDELGAAVTRLERAERDRMQRAQLAAWNHAGIAPNGHGKDH